ncbi:MAG: Rrf2 family transcriptional regulator [Pedosphaera sp.]|nr:Rrf2 family transcriptional regulator [Pedosphaera sp.]MSU43140.1 Rrf2 family transcriptional regulator [Pedosphaera sp.]
MRLPVTCEYAARAMLMLAADAAGERRALKVEVLARAAGTSANCLVHVLLKLKMAGLVQSLRGKQGGYLLARSRSKITLGDVVRAVEGDLVEAPAQSGDGPPELRAAWARLRAEVNTAADRITLEELLEARSRGREMYYI